MNTPSIDSSVNQMNALPYPKITHPRFAHRVCTFLSDYSNRHARVINVVASAVMAMGFFVANRFTNRTALLEGIAWSPLALVFTPILAKDRKRWNRHFPKTFTGCVALMFLAVRVDAIGKPSEHFVRWIPLMITMPLFDVSQDEDHQLAI